jgi:Zn-finger nucleic acid-binding protein
MVVLELEEIEIDHCLDCKGIWLDKGELELLLEDSGKKDNLLSSFKPATGAKEKKEKCPVCLKKMQKVLCGEKGGILIDKCQNNDGLWFDKGELFELIKQGFVIDKDNKILDLMKNMFKE